MASSRNLEGNYHIFLSFRGTDVRKNFLSHLYATLDQEGIYTYVDSEELRKGEQITPALMKAIQDSRIAIIIFSEDYASSPWCLEEVVKIMECKEQRNLVVFPVFYKVKPQEVRTPRQSYQKAMVKHERKFGKDSEKVNRWKKALFDAGNLSRWDFNDDTFPGFIRDEAEFIKRIVKEISMHLHRTPLDVAKHPIGIHPRIVDLESMLNLESDNDVLMIGLWGQGGIGKTTLAKALYNHIFKRFEASCFLANVRETSNDSKCLVPLQENLLSQMLLGKGLTVFNVARGINLIQDRLCHKKVLLVLDDVDDVKQLNALAGEREWFGKGSRIIITTRDNHLFAIHRIDKRHVYEVETLKYREALKLFNKHAFLRSREIVIRRDHVDKGYTKEIFLDIACFFKGKSIKYIMEVLNSCDFDTTIGIQLLVERSLITRKIGTIQMHDLIQLMGMDIGTNAIKAVVLDLHRTKAIYIGPNAFGNMRRLRFLIMINVHNSFQGPIRLPNELRWFQWPKCASSVLEFPPGPKKLVRLDMHKSNIQVAMGQFKVRI
ncbi:hypothetical protein BT93_L1717 [Corymbia citriodora subsp. variegata]|uniref:TIR domain-containing protein n=1 Tax=Corymbia citriodora subsp. variegata TaxID=360336 RepID=A0A8T0CM07_CORYI|nr:hypothetical protein BT93_L1717 [Corymbia citriodora subsp. variegata]